MENQRLSKEDQMIDLMQKQLLHLRILSGVMAGILLLTLIMGGVLVSRINKAVKAVEETVTIVNEEVLPVVSDFDMEAFNEGVSTFNASVQKLDIAALNKAVTDLSDAVDDFDIAGLNKAIDNLNKAVQPLVALSGFLSGGNSDN
ncbi:MAG: hypothetical protein KBS83_01720 [Lachnospiraceae bacterium]|nr:hypothetical protein [Candidatus Equihabitans merdae]